MSLWGSHLVAHMGQRGRCQGMQMECIKEVWCWQTPLLLLISGKACLWTGFFFQPQPPNHQSDPFESRVEFHSFLLPKHWQAGIVTHRLCSKVGARSHVHDSSRCLWPFRVWFAGPSLLSELSEYFGHPWPAARHEEQRRWRRRPFMSACCLKLFTVPFPSGPERDG